MGTLKGLAKRLRKIAKDIPEGLNEVTKQVALRAAYNLIQDTPVDTSKALSNWQVRIGGPATGEIEAHSPGKFGSTVGASSSTARALAEAAIKARRPGQAIYITNNLDYIKELNQGSSRQAPAGFVEVAVLRAKMVIKEAKVLR